MVNPLVAGSVDTASPFSGAFLIEDGQALVEAIQSGNWVEGGVAAFSSVLDTAAAVIDPIGTLIANGLGWVLDHVEPLKGWMNDFTGDAGEVMGFAQTWRNVGTRMHDTADAFARRTHDLEDMSGATVDAYLAFAGDAVKHFHATGDWATAIGHGMEMAAQLVQVVHDLVRDAISQVVGTAISVAAEMALTFGLATPAAITQITTKVGALATKVGRSVTRLLAGFKKLSGLLDSLKALFTKSSGLLSNMLHGKSGRTTRASHQVGEGVVRAINADSVRFSQRTVSFSKVDRLTGERYTFNDIVGSMREHGWKGDPIDAVQMRDGELTSLDNTRVLAARETGTSVRATIHDPSDSLTAAEADRFFKPKFGSPSTWGDAVDIRIQSQTGRFGERFPHGTHDLPRLTGRP